MTVNLIDRPPVFSSQLTDQQVEAGKTISYTLPSSSHPEGFSFYTSVMEHGSTTLPSFVSFTDPTFTIGPTQLFGTYLIDVIISDGVVQSTYHFNIVVAPPTNALIESLIT